MVERVEQLRAEARFRVLRILERKPELSQREIAEALGISLGSVNFLLRALIAKGHIKVTNFRQSNDKLRYAYVLTPSGIAERAVLTGDFLRRKMQEFEAIRVEIDALMAETSDLAPALMAVDWRALK